MTYVDSQLQNFIFRQSSDGILILSENGIVEDCNPAFLLLLKLGEMRISGISIQALFEDQPLLLSLLTAPADQSALVTLFDQQHIRLTVYTLDDGRRAVLFQPTVGQSTLSALREKFAQVVAHDLRNPAAVLIGFSSLVETSGILDEENLEYLSRVQETSTKLHHAAGDLTELAWIEAGMPIENRPLDFAALAAAAVSSLAKFAEEQGVAVNVESETPLPELHGDPDLLRSVLRRILHNAIQYSDRGTAVTVRLWSEPGSLFCAVSDQGFGIAAHELDHVFERFYRASDPRVKALPGGGLGLTLARKLVRLYGGEIGVVSQPGYGSTFTLRLPASTPA